jgi:MFS family permease
MTSSSPAAPRWDARLWGALILLCGVLFLDGLDVSMVGVALPSIQSDLGLTTSQLQWVVSAYVLGTAGCCCSAAALPTCSAAAAS